MLAKLDLTHIFGKKLYFTKDNVPAGKKKKILHP
jgi:hypothetical protein